MAKTSSYPLRLSQSVMREAKETAAREGIPLNQFIAGAVGEKLSALRTEDLLKERARRADWRRVQAILDRVGTIPPQEGDELPG
jgi:HicB family